MTKTLPRWAPKSAGWPWIEVAEKSYSDLADMGSPGEVDRMVDRRASRAHARERERQCFSNTLASVAARISAPPASTVACSVAPPHHTAVSAANSTSHGITTAVIDAFRRAAPYCRHRFEIMKTIASPKADSSQLVEATGQA